MTKFLKIDFDWEFVKNCCRSTVKKKFTEGEERSKNMCGEVCTDNRFKIIDKVKNTLLERTNIDKSPKELEVLDAILFRLWQCRFFDNVEVEE